MLQQKLSRFSVALRRPGFTSATIKFAAGTAKPSPPPYAPMQKIPIPFGPTNSNPTPALISRSPVLIANRNPQRAANMPDTRDGHGRRHILHIDQSACLGIVQRPSRRKDRQHRTEQHGCNPDRHERRISSQRKGLGRGLEAWGESDGDMIRGEHARQTHSAATISELRQLGGPARFRRRFPHHQHRFNRDL